MELNGLGFANVPSLTFIDGVKEWIHPVGAVQSLSFAVGNIANTPGYTFGLLTPILAALFLLIPKGDSYGGATTVVYRRGRK